MANLTVQAITKAGITDILANLDAADVAGDDVAQSSGLLIVVDNADVGSHTLTVAAPVANADCDPYGSLPVADLTLVVAAGTYGFITIPPGYGASNLFSWTYDDVTSVTVGVFSLAP